MTSMLREASLIEGGYLDVNADKFGTRQRSPSSSSSLTRNNPASASAGRRDVTAEGSRQPSWQQHGGGIDFDVRATSASYPRAAGAVPSAAAGSAAFGSPNPHMPAPAPSADRGRVHQPFTAYEASAPSHYAPAIFEERQGGSGGERPPSSFPSSSSPHGRLGATLSAVVSGADGPAGGGGAAAIRSGSGSMPRTSPFLSGANGNANVNGGNGRYPSSSVRSFASTSVDSDVPISHYVRRKLESSHAARQRNGALQEF